MDKQKTNGKMKMLQVPISEKQFETLKDKAEKEKRSLPNQVKIYLEPYMSDKSIRGK